MPLKLDGDARPTELKLPAGEVHLQFHVREDGAKLGKLWLTADPNGKPE